MTRVVLWLPNAVIERLIEAGELPATIDADYSAALAAYVRHKSGE